jgi:serine/threonine protein kinase
MMPMLETIGHYRIRRKIGEGGMGVVYEGWDERLERAVAIKAIRETNESSDARKRLWREARSLARVNHPGVCQVFDVIEDGDTLVLILELLEGQSLADRLARSPITTLEAVSIERQILEALQALHDLDIVHRDLKPSNAFLTRHGVKLLDFGLARSADSATSCDMDQAITATIVTAAGVIVGTPQYMAPEQASGRLAGPAVDIFASGCILYEMLTRKQPFAGDSFVDVLYAVLHHDPPPLSGSPEIEALDQLIRRAMAKRPENRYSSPREMLDAVNAVLLSGSTRTVSHAQIVTRLIALPFRMLKKDADTDFLAYSLPDAISSSLSSIDSLIVRSSQMGSMFEGVTDPKRVAVEADVDAILTGSVLRAGDRIRLNCQLVEAPGGTVIWSDTATSSIQDLFKIQDELCDGIVKSLRLPLNDRERSIFRRDVPTSARAFEYYLRANQMAATKTLDDMRLARDMYLQCVDEGPDYAPAWARLGRAYRFIEKFGDDYEADLKRADEAFNRAFALNPDLAIAHNLYTPVECDQGRSQDAMVRLLTRAQLRRNDPDLFAGLVQACRYCDELEASVAAHHRGRHLDPHLLTSVEHTYFLLGDYSKTLDCYAKKSSYYYLDCAALVALGDNKTALSRLRERDRPGGAAGPVQAIMRSLRAYIEGDFQECLNAIEIGESLTQSDPEILYYAARHLARINHTDRAVTMLSRMIDRGFLCAFAISRDPWFASLHSSPQYAELMHNAEIQRGKVHAAFLEAGGEQLISIV